MIHQLLYGVAYYDEYMPYERLDRDIEMMLAAGINVVRIAESTWSTVEPQDGVFDFTSIDRVLAAMHRAGIHVIIGTPTYAVPTWMVKKYPEILAVTPRGQNQYGSRQNMDITNPHYRFYAERVIRKMMEHVSQHPAVIGYQVDNETKPYQTCGENVQAAFVDYVKEKFVTLEKLNDAFGLAYWSNRINAWEDFPSVVGTINASLACEFEKFQRGLVRDFLAWQAAVIREYSRPGQFITHNFDGEWRGYTYGIQPEVDHFATARALDYAGFDIYHNSQDLLTGLEISFSGDLARSMKAGKNYLVLETQAQGFPAWTPYPGQLRLQAFSHLASGAIMVSYWHWHSIHNSAETYWKGLLSHDLQPNEVYREAKTIGADFARLSDKLINLRKRSDIAILFSNEALSGFKAFAFGNSLPTNYNDVLRQFYDSLYRVNISCDLVDPSSENIEGYRLLIVPLLYAAPDSLLERLNDYVRNGGHIIYTAKSGFSDENVKVRTTPQPGLLHEACGIGYNQFTLGPGVTLKQNIWELAPADQEIKGWMELITPTTARVLASYHHPFWEKYAAITENSYGRGVAIYVGCLTAPAVTDRILEDVLRRLGLWGADQETGLSIVIKSGVNQAGKTVRYYFNYSGIAVTLPYTHEPGEELISGKRITTRASLDLPAWGFQIIEQDGPTYSL